jgi:methyl-accepting chemotaxis protein
MTKEIPFHRTLGAKLGGIVLAFALLVIALVIANVVAFTRLQSDLAWLDESGQIRGTNYNTLYLLTRIDRSQGADRATKMAELRNEIDASTRIRRELLEGGPLFDAPTDPDVVANLRQRESRWNNQIDPLLDRAIAMPEGQSIEPLLGALEPLLLAQAQDVAEGNRRAMGDAQRRAAEFRMMNNVLAALALIMLGGVMWAARSIARRTTDLASAAQRISGGDLDHEARIAGTDEVALLGGAFNEMTGSLKRSIDTEKERRAQLSALLDTIAEAANRLSATSTEILAATTEQASGAQEQAAAVAQTVSTVDEVTQTAEQAAERAKALSASSQRAVDIGEEGGRAVDESVSSMASVRAQVETIAESILALAEQAQAIGEIIATVNDIAEQTNLLALNAAIEASRAGEAGRGFSVVASEVKALADQSKKATAQVGKILGDIQRATNEAVLSTERGSRSVESASKVVEQTGTTIRTLLDTLEQAAQVAAQIAASAGQQATGMTQVHMAMNNINQATNQNVAASRQAERAARDLNDLAGTLKAQLDRTRPVTNG